MADVLIVDSEYPSRLSLKIALKNQGLIPDASDNPEEALEKVRINHYNWVICDLKMGEIDPISLSQKIKEMKPDMKMIFTSAYLGKEDMGSAEIEAFLPKPIDITEMLQLFRKYDKGFKDKSKGFQIDLDLAVNE